ncbi:hypothetical protein GOBAR_AA27895 [Gossypium barbadense]|uniref:non-specific serine/threonine protein kinase n=1 Tax=Gossypium barbadense TaxID=3634 RepID=A0A2P5WNY7_GOSBA|nr:hypothetical protein GOBAR_AA27895 [Gossypium barbadense]
MGLLSFTLLILGLFQLVSAQQNTDPNEVAALRTLINYWNLGSKINLTIDPCNQNASWTSEDSNPRVACDCSSNICHITHLKIYALDIKGEIPKELFELKELMDLNLGQNVLNGSIPAEIGQLSKMQYSFSSNNFFGPLPKELGNLTSLQQLSLRNCRLSGQIPERIGKFTNLKYMDLSFNKLTGQIPTSFRGFSSLQFLYLGNNNLSGELTEDMITPELIALDVSFNPLSGNLPTQFAKTKSINVVGTSINANGLQDNKVSGMLNCIQGKTKCKNKGSSTSFSIKCGGTAQKSASGIEFDDDSEALGAAALYTSTDEQWAVSNAGNFISNPKGNRYVAMTDSQITETLESELYKTSRISPSSLRYYGLDLKNGKYSVELHFAEIEMEDSSYWKGLGRRLFDVYIQGEKVLEDFNIQKEAGGSKKALVKTFEANVTNTIMEIHFFWAGKGTCCIPYQSTYGPLVSAIHASQVSEAAGASSSRKHVGQIAGIVIGAVASVVILSSVFYLWWKKDPQGLLNKAGDWGSFHYHPNVKELVSLISDSLMVFLVFGKSSLEANEVVKNALDFFYKMSRLQMNSEKCEIRGLV